MTVYYYSEKWFRCKFPHFKFSLNVTLTYSELFSELDSLTTLAVPHFPLFSAETPSVYLRSPFQFHLILWAEFGKYLRRFVRRWRERPRPLTEEEGKRNVFLGSILRLPDWSNSLFILISPLLCEFPKV